MLNTTRIPLTKHQAEAIRADITEINRIQEILAVKSQANKRMTDVMVLDAGLDPETYAKYSLEEKNGKAEMVLEHKDQSAPSQGHVNGAATEPMSPEVTQ